MRKILFFVLSFLALQTTVFAVSFPSSGDPQASAILLTVGKKQITLPEYIKLTPFEYRELTGQRLGIAGSVKLKLAQWKLKKLVQADGRVNAKKAFGFFDGSDFHWGGYLLGLFLGPIGVIIAYFINDDLKSERVKWAWWGLMGFVSMVLLALTLAGAS